MIMMSNLKENFGLFAETAKCYSDLIHELNPSDFLYWLVIDSSESDFSSFYVLLQEYCSNAEDPSFSGFFKALENFLEVTEKNEAGN